VKEKDISTIIKSPQITKERCPMTIIAQERNYIPVDIETRYHAVQRRIESKWKVKKILSFYHVKKSSLYRWLKQYDGSKESLKDKSHRPQKKHPRSIKEKIIKKIINLQKREPNRSFLEIWVKLKRKGIEISAISVLRILKRNQEYREYKPNRKKHDKKYHTPSMVHEKWQMDVKYVPKECKAKGLEGKYYQYTILDECSRKRILYFTNEHSMYETVKAIEYAIERIGCYPKEIQTDNGFEFTDRTKRKVEKENILEEFLRKKQIRHHFIRPRTPEHNGKVERSHRIDQDKFYRYLKFYSLEDLRYQGALWNRRYNDMPKIVLEFKTPNEIELEKLIELLENTGEVRCPKRLTSFDT